MLNNDIDIDSLVRHEIFCEDADEIFFDEVYGQSFSLADKTLKSLLLDKTEWLNEVLIENFQTKYTSLSVSKLDEVSLLMCEAVAINDEKCIYDIFMAAVHTNFVSFRSMVYLLEKATFYCQDYFYPYKIFSYMEKNTRYSVDYHLLANSLAGIFEKYHIVNAEAVKNLLDKSKEKMNSHYEKISLSFSYLQNGYLKEAEEIFKPTIDLIVDEIKDGNISYQLVRSLIMALGEEYETENDIGHSWELELSNKLYGAFYNDEN